MRRITGLLMLLAVLGLAAGCGKKGDDTGSGGGGGGGGGGGSSSSSGLEGTYTMVGMEMNGMSMDAFLTKSPEADRTIKITSDKMIATKNGKEDPMTYKANTSKTPHEIDMVESKGGKEEKSYGIYKVDGDKLIICMTQSDNPADRPKDFTTPKIDMKNMKKDTKMVMIMTLQKKK